MVYSVDPDQAFPEGAVWSGPTLFVIPNAIANSVNPDRIAPSQEQ